VELKDIQKKKSLKEKTVTIEVDGKKYEAVIK